MKHLSWRDASRQVIAETLAACVGKPEAEIKRALFDAYPWGERAMHPYKIWCDEIRRQRGLKPDPQAVRDRRAQERVGVFEQSLTLEGME